MIFRQKPEPWPWNPDAEPAPRVREDLQRIALSILDRKSHPRPTGIVFASPHAGAGVSSVVLGLARELGQIPGMRCVIVELNRLRPRFAERYSLDARRSAASLAAHEAVLSECVQKAAGGVSIVPAGSGWPGTLAARIACRAMQEAEGEFDAVLFDVPPTGECADAIAVASAVKEMIVVAAAGRTEAASLRELRAQAAGAGARISGGVLTMRDRVAPAWLFGRERR